MVPGRGADPAEADVADWYEVANLDEIPPTGLEVLAGEESVLLFRDGDAVRALAALCSHQDMELAGGCLEDGAWVCPHHGARFNAATGEALSMPAVEPVATFEVKLEGTRVFVRSES
jgi:3-phenylpropionate/trans-cinnamate dioxygenase ferredoxin subunit